LKTKRTTEQQKMAVSANEGNEGTLPLMVLEREDSAVADLFKRLLSTKSDAIKAEFESDNEDGIPCLLGVWAAGLTDIDSGDHLGKLVPVPVSNSAMGMHNYLEAKKNSEGIL
jgi:hypothetical protein